MADALRIRKRAQSSEMVDPAGLLDLAYDAIFVRTFQDRRIIFWNRGAERMYGFARSEALGRIPGELLQTKYPIPLEEIEDTIAETGHWEGILEQVGHDGRRLTVNARWALSTDSSRQPAGILEINSDVTERHQAEQRLDFSEERFKILVEAVQDYAIFMLDPHGHIISWNRGAQRIKGYTAEEIIGKHFSIFYPKEDVEAGKPERVLEKARTEGRIEDESWRVRKDGSRFWANVVVTALRDPNGTIRGFTKVTRDLTERKRQQDSMMEMRAREAAQLREHARRMEDLEKAKGRLLNLASHELRGPLAVLRGYISMIADGSIKPEQIPSVAPILLAKTNQINSLVQQMLEAARLEDSRLQLIKKKVNLVEIIQDAVAELSPLLPEGQKIIVKAPASLEADVDGERIHTVITNLLDNAIKYSLGRGDIACTLQRSDGRARISVSDQGPGIPSADMNRLFGRFERIITDENNHVPGTGLGLHLARELARLHGGDLSASSTIGKGSEFILTLPI